MLSEAERVRRALGIFDERFGGSSALVVRAPGRVNLLGEHTDYNEGFVLPAAIDRSVIVVARPRSDRVVNVYSTNYRRSYSYSLDETAISNENRFISYVHGVSRTLENQGYRLKGLDALVEGNVPIGSGLSSSAALEMAVLLGFEAASGLSVPPTEKARVGQRVENEFIGVKSGIMDQLASVYARRRHVILIDCRTLSCELIPMDTTDVKIVVCDSRVRRTLAKSEYNRRREECGRAVEILAKLLPGIRSLRDVNPRQLSSLKGMVSEPLWRRCSHVVNESERVLTGMEALKRRDLDRFGELMGRSHESLRDLFEVSCYELNLLVEAAMSVEGVLGSRMTGAGFGGCTVSLVKAQVLDDFVRQVGEVYARSTGRKVPMWVCEPADGAGVILELAGGKK